MPEDAESTLAWALREAVTNVVRHSGARRCTVDVVRRETLDGPVLELTVEDDGQGGSSYVPGNGLRGRGWRRRGERDAGGLGWRGLGDAQEARRSVIMREAPGRRRCAGDDQCNADR